MASPNPEEAKLEHRRAFVAWTLAHEIGHVIHKHEAAHFSDNSFFSEVSNLRLSQKQEIEADEFAYKRIYDHSDIALIVERLLIDLLNSEIYQKTEKADIPHGVGILFNYHEKQLLEFSSKRTHPEYIFRCINLLSYAGKRKGNKWITNQLLEFIIKTKFSDRH